MMRASVLIEIRSEELPPKSLQKLSSAFAEHLLDSLVAQGYVETGSPMRQFATPRRLAVWVPHVLAVQPPRQIERKGPAQAAGLKDGQPSPALLGFARACGISVDQLEIKQDGKQAHYVFRSTEAGVPLAAQLTAMVAEALSHLPTAKRMRWGSGEVEFVRPLHGLLMLHGDQLIPGSVMGLDSVNTTLGHRFMSTGVLQIAHADAYENTLLQQGWVEADFVLRRENIRGQLSAQAKTDHVLWDEALLEEVTALVEFPVVCRGEFSADFLAVPQECLILSMKQHQKYFPLVDKQGRLLPGFLVVSNLKTADPGHIIHGNERVLRARLSDARFFFEQDRKQRLDARVPKLAQVVYHNKLGSQLERVERLVGSASTLAHTLGADSALAARAAYLAKADLLTDMVGEFPELQGVMGRYYAQYDGEAPEVAEAMASHYLPRFAGDGLPTETISSCVALADKLDTLVGMFGIGQIPTGDKDPFGLRRAALGVLRIVIEQQLPVSLTRLIATACSPFPAGLLDAQTPALVHGFMLDRLRNVLKDQAYEVAEIEAVLACQADLVEDILARLVAIRAFRQLPEAPALAAANKRVANLLKKVETSLSVVEQKLLTEEAERQLYAVLLALHPIVSAHVSAKEYTAALSALAGVRQSVDAFFDGVMVMVDDLPVRANRLALLARLRELMNQVADIGLLPG